MANTRVSIIRNWYGKIPSDKHGKPIPKNLWPKRRKHSWEVRWYGSDGKRYSKSFKTRKEANEHAKIIQAKVDKGKADKARKITLSEFSMEHNKVMVGQVAHSTLKDQMRALRFFADHLGHDMPLDRIKPRYAESFISYRLASGRTAGTVNKDIRTLKAIFNLAIEPRGYLAEGANPFLKIKQRKLASPPVKYVPIEDFQKVFMEAKTLWWKSLLVLAYTSGGRRDELLNLTWVDIDFENQCVRFVPKRASEFILEWEPKDHECRTIPIPPETIQLLADLQAEADEKSPYVFINSKRLAHILDRRAKGNWEPDNELINNLLMDLNAMSQHAGVKEFTLHDLRRSCITNWAQKLPIQTVQQLAGHSNMETTRKYYRPYQMSRVMDEYFPRRGFCGLVKMGKVRPCVVYSGTIFNHPPDGTILLRRLYNTRNTTKSFLRLLRKKLLSI